MADSAARRKEILTEIYAKLLVLVLQHWLLVVGCWAGAGAGASGGGWKPCSGAGWSLARAWGAAFMGGGVGRRP